MANFSENVVFNQGFGLSSEKFTMGSDKVFEYLIYCLKQGKTLVFDYTKLPGGRVAPVVAGGTLRADRACGRDASGITRWSSENGAESKSQANPAEMTWVMDDKVIKVSVIYMGTPSIHFGFPLSETKDMYLKYVKHTPGFERVSWYDSTGIKQPIVSKLSIQF